MTILVIKFGGTSVRYGSNEIINIINNETKKYSNIVIVLSALSKVTHLLVEAIDYAINKDKNYITTINTILEIHETFYTNNITNNITKNIYNNFFMIQNKLQTVEFLLYKIYSNKIEYSNELYDTIISYGEILSLYTISNLFINNNILYKSISSNKYIFTDNNYKNASVNFDETENAIKNIFLPLLENNKIILTTGFIGYNTKGDSMTTLGRGGSDYSASLISALINANKLYIMTDVDGIMTCDPRKVTKAVLLDEIDYTYLSEMSYYGAKIIHPKTLLPIINSINNNNNNNNNIDIYVKNTFNYNTGTLIKQTIEKKICKTIYALTSIENINLINIKGTGLNGNIGLSGRIFSLLGELGINIPFITQASSESLITFAILNTYSKLVIDNLKKCLDKELSLNLVDNIECVDDIVLINIICCNIINKCGISGTIFKLLGDNNININAISQGSSEISITIVVNKEDEIKTLNILHSLIN